MKQMKAMAALLAAVTALLPFAADALTVQNVSAVSAEETGTVSEQKKWLPTDFESAVEFRNTYGATHIADDTVCIVLRKEQEVVLDGNTAFLPRYEVITTKGVMSLSYNTGFGDIYSRYSYEVRLYHPTEPGEFRIALRDNGEETAVYTFAVDNEMHVRETDLCGWLPDCYTEFKDYVKQNGAVSVHENHVVFCQECGVGTAYSWKEADKEYHYGAEDNGKVLMQTRFGEAEPCGCRNPSYDYDTADNTDGSIDVTNILRHIAKEEET